MSRRDSISGAKQMQQMMASNDRKRKEEDDLFLKQFQRDEPDYFKTNSSYQLVKHIDYVFESKMEEKRNQVVFFITCLLLIAFVCGSTFYAVGGLEGKRYDDLSMSEAIWQSWLIIMDPGIEYNAKHQPNRVIAAVTTVIGVMFAATLTGFVVDAVKQKLDRFRAGLVVVQEWDHTVLIGWTDRSVGFILQICIANKESGGTVIVVLAEQDKLQMEREFNSTVSEDDLRGSRVIFRSGNPQRIPSLHLAAVPAARVIVIMSMGSGSYDADATTLRIIVALTVVGVKPEGWIVAEVRDPEFDTVIKFTGGPQLETIQSNDMNARVSLSAVKQPGITKAFEEIIGFEGDEFYTKVWPEVTGQPFDLMAGHFPDCIPLGVKSANGDVTLCPRSDYIMKETDGLIVLAEDSLSYVYTSNPPPASTVPPGIPPNFKMEETEQRKILVCGWGENLRFLLRMLSQEFEEGTKVHLFNRVAIKDRRARLLDEIGVEMQSLKHLDVTHIVGDPSQWRTMSALDLDSYHCVLVISDNNITTSASSDSQNLASILMLRHHDLIREHNLKREEDTRGELNTEEDAVITTTVQDAQREGVALVKPKDSVNLRKNEQAIFVEIRDTQTQELIEAHSYLAEACRFLVSNRLISKVLAMVAEDRTVRKILDSLLGGNTVLSLVPSEMFVEKGERASFYVVARRARMLRHIIIGYQHKLRHSLTSLNPKDKGIVRKWDQVTFIVMTRAPAARKSVQKTHKLDMYQERFSLDEFAAHATGEQVQGETVQATPGIPAEVISLSFTLNESLGFRLFGAGDDGLVVSGVTAGGQAHSRGVKLGYRVVAVDSLPVSHQAELLSIVEQAKEQGRSSAVLTFSPQLEGDFEENMEDALMERVQMLEAEVLREREMSAQRVFQVSEAFNAAKQLYEDKIRTLEQSLKEREATSEVVRRSSGRSSPSRKPSIRDTRGESEPRTISETPSLRSGSTPRKLTSGLSPRTITTPTSPASRGISTRPSRNFDKK